MSSMAGPSAQAVVHERDRPPASRQHLLDEARKHLSVIDSFLPEVEHFLKVVSDRVKVPRVIGLPAYVRKLEREREVMRWAAAKLGDEDPPEGEALKLIGRKLVASATMIQHEAMHWDILKRCRSLAVVDQTFQGLDREGRRKEVSRVSGNGRDKQQLHRTLKEQSKVDVDVVEGGGEWIDIRWLQADRLARQMADSGWGWGEYELGDRVDPSEWEDMPAAKQIRRIVAAARLNRHEYRIPRVRIVMPNLSKGADRDIDVLLDQFTRLDASAEVVIEDAASEFLRTPPPDLETAVRNLLGDERSGLTETLNMDHTILIDLISDITHSKLEPQPWQAPTTRAQIEEERQQDGGVMARTLYPILQDRVLVCTQEAAEHFHEVLKTVGTSTERERGKLLVPDHNARDPTTEPPSPETIRHHFQQLSIHPLPPNLRIPIRIIPDPWTLSTVHSAISSGALPPLALDVARCGNFKSSKLSIYMYGWASGTTTVTSNKEIRGQIRTWVEANRRDDGERGPAIWRVEVTRNLLAKSATPPDGFLG